MILSPSSSRWFLAALFACGGLLTAQEDGHHWFDNYGRAMAEAKRTGKPIFLEYRCEP